MIGHVKKYAVILLWVFIWFPQFAQDSNTFGWQPFEIPGLPEREQLVIRNMLLSDNPRLQRDALETLYQGVSTGRISSASEEYSIFVDQVFKNLFLVRSQQSGNRMIETYPRTIITLLNLLAYTENPLFQSRLVDMFAIAPEPFVVQHAMTLIVTHGKPISKNLEQSISEVLWNESLGLRQPDGLLIRSILRAYRRSFLNHETTMSNRSVQALLAIRNRTSDNSLRQEILETLELIFNL
jgi:hypothetical protein